MINKEQIFKIGIGTWKIDYERLNKFRSKEFDNVEIDWQCNGGITIDQLANQFE